MIAKHDQGWLIEIASRVRHTPLHPQWLLGGKKLPEELGGVSGTLLDLGAADRWLESRLPTAVHYVALDHLSTGQALYGAKPDVFADGAFLPFSEECFDHVVCFEVLEHVHSPARVVGEIYRVLKPGGRAWLSMPFLYPLHDAPYDFQRYTVYGLERDIELAGLEITKLLKTGHALTTAGLLTNLALAGGAQQARGWRKWIFLPAIAVAVPVINVITWFTSRLWPDWPHMAHGYELEVRKP